MFGLEVEELNKAEERIKSDYFILGIQNNGAGVSGSFVR